MLDVTYTLIREGWVMAPEGSQEEEMFSDALKEISKLMEWEDEIYDLMVQTKGKI